MVVFRARGVANAPGQVRDYGKRSIKECGSWCENKYCEYSVVGLRMFVDERTTLVAQLIMKVNRLSVALVAAASARVADHAYVHDCSLSFRYM